MVRLAVVTTHPIQYYAPIFQLLARSESVALKVFYTWSQSQSGGVADPWLNRHLSWDIPLTEGYDFEFVPNIARRPGSHHFWGLRNPTLASRIESWKADAVLVFAWNMASHLAALRHFKGRIPVLFRGDSNLLNPTSRWRTLARRIALRWVYSHIDVALAVGSNNRDYFRWCGIPADRIRFAPHAVDLTRFAGDVATHEEQAATWRREFGIPAGARTLVYAGKIYDVKNPLLLLEAFVRAGKPGHLIFVGEGDQEAQVRERGAGLRNVHFLPFQNQRLMPAVYRLGEVFVLPSRFETWGLVVNEAMATGRPVIATHRVGAARDLIIDGVSGWIFESDNLPQLTQIVAEALTCDPAKLREMGARAAREIRNWSTQAAADGIESAVLAFTGAGHPRPAEQPC